MLKSLKRMFQTEDPVDQNGRLDARLASAVLMVETAVADGHMSDTERHTLGRRLMQHFDLSADEADSLIEEAEGRQEESQHLLRFTRAIKDGLDQDGRIDLMEMLWEIVLADGVVDPFEDQLLRRIAGLIYVTDQDRAEARRRVEARRA
ncbi:MAG: TerB family tellurite resistance protein [Rhodothalassiaceae bacterium]